MPQQLHAAALMSKQHPKQHSSSKGSGRFNSAQLHMSRVGASQSMLATLAMLDHVQQRLHITQQ